MAGKNDVRLGVGVKDNATKPIKGISDAFYRLQKQGAKGFAIGAGAAITTKAFSLLDSAASSVIGTLGDSIKTASDLGEQMSKSGVIFGNAADDIQDFGDKAAVALGLSKRAALEAASNFGMFFTGLGKSGAEAAEMSKRLVTLGADLASFNNLDPTEVLQKLQSGLSGEAEPMRKLGVFLTAAKVEAKAMELGLADTHGELSEGAKVLARYQIILDETGKAQGDFARTSSGLANSQRRTAALIENAQVLLGAKLLGLAESFQIALAEILSSEFAHMALVARLEKLSNDELERLANERLLTAAGTDKKIAASAVLLARQLEQAREHANRLAHSAPPGVTGWVALEGAFDDLTQAEIDAEQEAKDFEQAIKDAGDAAEQSKKQFDKTTDQIDLLADALFGGAQKTGELAEAKKDLNDLLKEGPETKSAQDIAIWKGKVAEAREALFLLQLAMARADGPAALQAFLLDVIETTGEADVAVRALAQSILNTNAAYVALAAMSNASKDDAFIPVPRAPATPRGTTDPRGTKRAFAEGGFLPTGGTGTVGEEGIEQIRSVPGGTVITPTSTPGGGVTINLTIQGDVRARSKEDVVRELIRAAAFIRG